MIYVIGSLKNPRIPVVAEFMRCAGLNVFDDWYSPGPETDDYWQAHCRQRGYSYTEALDTPHAWNVFEFDKRWLDACSVVVLVMPAGKSGHLELGYAIGRGKLGYILMEEEPERFDVMHRFATDIATDLGELTRTLVRIEGVQK